MVPWASFTAFSSTEISSTCSCTLSAARAKSTRSFAVSSRSFAVSSALAPALAFTRFCNSCILCFATERSFSSALTCFCSAVALVRSASSSPPFAPAWDVAFSSSLCISESCFSSFSDLSLALAKSSLVFPSSAPAFAPALLPCNRAFSDSLILALRSAICFSLLAVAFISSALSFDTSARAPLSLFSSSVLPRSAILRLSLSSRTSFSKTTRLLSKAEEEALADASSFFDSSSAFLAVSRSRAKAFICSPALSALLTALFTCLSIFSSFCSASKYFSLRTSKDSRSLGYLAAIFFVSSSTARFSASANFFCSTWMVSLSAWHMPESCSKLRWIARIVISRFSISFFWSATLDSSSARRLWSSPVSIALLLEDELFRSMRCPAIPR
mmetsp:Transcript_3179/g.7938  ORF Transcript_3179/g.7938 Transcript_3179/m.7938 type:complete len:386 (+) Transcript_3179:591-1748(+)